MPAEPLPLASISCGFLLALARVSAVFAFVPFAGWKGVLDPGRAVFVLAITIGLYQHWPKVDAIGISMGTLLVLMLRETTLGLAVGVATALLLEAVVMGAQLVAIQAGFSYASTVDPTSQADSNVLQAVAQLFAGLLLLSFELDRHIIRATASGLSLGREIVDPAILWRQWHMVADLGAGVWMSALRLAAPLVLFLLLVDLALSCLGRINTQLQLLSVAFPAKILATVALLAMMAGTVPYVFRQQAERFIVALGAR